MNTPEYLQEVLEEAEDRLKDDDATLTGTAKQVAEEHRELTCQSQGSGDRNNLDVLKDIRDIHGICADELDPYRATSPSQGSWGAATVEAVVRRSLEDLIATHLSENQPSFC